MMGTVSFANANISENKEIKNVIIQNVSYPKFLKDKKQTAAVKISFMIDENGTIKILEMNSADQNLKAHVNTELKKIKLEQGKYLAGDIYNINLIFKLV